jgi:ABC-type glycerol-3-phosphate transport system substrate-binding protein
MIIDEIKYWNENYSKKTGITVESEILSFQGYFDKVTAQLVSGAKEPDIFFVWSYYAGAFAPYAEDLNPYLDDKSLFSSPNGEPYNKDDMYPNAYEAGNYKGKQVMLPHSAGNMVLIYRKDLIPKPPETWDELIEVAKKFTKRHNPDSPTTYGLALCGRGPIDTTSWKTWLCPYWDYGGNYFEPGTFKPDFNNEAGLKAANLFSTIMKEGLAPPEVTTFAFLETMAAMQTGDVAMILDWQVVYTRLTNKEQSPKVYDKVAWAAPPGVKQPDGSIKRYSYLGANCYLINKNSLHKKEAFKFLAWYLFGEGMEHDVLYKGNNPMNRRAYEDPKLSEAETIKQYKATGVIPISRAEPAFPDLPTVQSIGAGAISGLLAGASPESTIAIIQNETALYLKQKGYFE